MHCLVDGRRISCRSGTTSELPITVLTGHNYSYQDKPSILRRVQLAQEKNSIRVDRGFDNFIRAKVGFVIS